MTVRLADYELGRALAKGGMGIVHEAVERATGRRVAIKRILSHVLDRDTVGRFLLEGRAVARLDHPGIVRVHAAGEADGAPFLVMELVEGESLARRLERDGPLAPDVACRLTARVADALAHAHARGVLHRDLKPANILVDATGAPRLIDFGLAKLAPGAGSLAHLTRTGELVGTPAFMAPEQANGGAAEARTDVYGLGATLFALLTGRPPFDGPNAMGVLHGVLTRPAAAPSASGAPVPQSLDRLVLDCLEKEPAARPASMAELVARLEACAGDEARPARSGPIALAALALLALLAAGAALSRGSASPAPAVAPIGSDAPVATAAQAAPSPLAVSRTRGWPAEALARTRRPDFERALAPPRDGASAAAWLAHARLLRGAGRSREASALLPRLEAGKDELLLRFVLAYDLEPSAADPAALDSAIAADPRWAEGLFVREVHRLRTRFDVPAMGLAFGRLRELGREDLRACLEAERCLVAPVTGPQLEDLLTALELAPLSATVVLARADVCATRITLLTGPRADLELERAEECLDLLLGREPLLARAYERRQWFLRRRQATEGVIGDALALAALTSRPEEVARHVLDATGALLPTYEGAKEALSWLPATPTDDAYTESRRAELLEALGREEAARAVRRAVLDEALPGPPTVYLTCAALLGGRDSWAERYLAHLSRDRPTSQADWCSAAAVLFGMGARREGLQAVDRAVELGGGRPARLLRADLLQAARRLPEALAELDLLVAEAPADRWALAARAAARAAAGDARATEDAERAARLPAAPGLEPTTALELTFLQKALQGASRLAPERFVDWTGTVNVALQRAHDRHRPLPLP